MEQEIAKEIKGTHVDLASIISDIGDIVFNEVYPSKKYKYGRYDFACDKYIDDTIIGAAAGGIRLRLITTANESHGAVKEKFISDSRVDNEAIIVLSGDVKYFEEMEQAAKIRNYIKQKNVSQLPLGIQEIIRGHQARAGELEAGAKAQIEKAIVGGAFYIYGEKAEIRSGDAKAKISESLKQLVESVYSKLNHVNTFCEADADIMAILGSEPDIGGIPGTGVNNEYALNEISQWLELQSTNFRPVSMGDVQGRYQAIPYGWREIDIAALVARLLAGQKISVAYGGAVVDNDDRGLVGYLRRKPEIDKTEIKRRIAPSEESMRKSVAFLRGWLGRTDIPGDEDGLVGFIITELERKRDAYAGLLGEYSGARYPQREVVEAAFDLMEDILSQRRVNVALLKRLLARQEDLRSSAGDMEAVESFFKVQRPVFDEALNLRDGLRGERDCFSTDPDTLAKLDGIEAILAMPKPYDRIKGLGELIQGVKSVYGSLLEQKKDEVRGIITVYMGDVHTLAGVRGKANVEVIKSDARFMEYKQRVNASTTLTLLDAILAQLQSYKAQVCKQIEQILHEPANGGGYKGDSPPPKIVQARRYDIFPVKRLTSRDDVDDYLDGIRKKLYDTLEKNDGIQIN